MNTYKKHISIIVIFAACSLAHAQGSVSDPSHGCDGPTKSVETDVIFDEILQSLPVEMKADVDSAAKAGTVSRTHQKTDVTGVKDEKRTTSQDALQDLPAATRAQVERAIVTIESAKQQRQVQFREQQEVKSGQK